MNELVQFSKHRDVAIITINNPPVNALSPGVLESILAAMEAVECDPEIKTAVLTGAGSTFIAGADIKEFGKITAGQKPRGEGLHPLLSRIEDCRKPIVMAIHGNAFGGGLELAMAGHYRIATPDARLGPAGSEARLDTGCRRNPAVTAPCWCCQGGRDVRARRSYRRAKGARVRLD